MMRENWVYLALLLLGITASAQSAGTCTAWGDPHYVTFDKTKHHFQGMCDYIFAQDCDSQKWKVITTNVPIKRGAKVSSIAKVYVEAPETAVTITRKDVRVAGKKIKLPHKSKGFTVLKRGRQVIVNTDIGVKVMYDQYTRVQVRVEDRWKGKTCGLCGTYNKNRADDKKMAQDHKEMQKIHHVGRDCGAPPPPPKCTEEQKKIAHEKCFMALSQISCLEVNFLKKQMEFCILDVCACGEKCICAHKRAYREECYQASKHEDYLKDPCVNPPEFTDAPTPPSKCGLRPLAIVRRIVGGVQAERHMHPWTVHFDIQHNLGPSRCAGTVIDKRWVISTAQCFLTKMNIYGTKYNLKKVTAKFGKHNLHKHEDGEVVMDIPLKNIIHHEDFHQEVDKQYKRYNIALIKLPKPLKFSKTIQPICLPEYQEPITNFNKNPLTLVGWGTKKDKQQTATLQEAQASIISLKKCEKKYPGIDKTVMCTKKDKISTCVGDGGGTIESKRDSGVYVLVGMNSFSKIETDARCLEGQIGGAVYVPEFVKWISDKTGKKFPQ